MTPARKDRSFQYRLMCRVYRVLRDPRTIIVFDRICGNPAIADRYGVPTMSVGACVHDAPPTSPIILAIDHRKDVVATIVHECLHVAYPDRSEGDIRKLEDVIVHHMHPRQAERVLRLALTCVPRRRPRIKP